MELVGHAQWLGEGGDGECVGRGGHTVGVEKVGELENGWCVVQGVLSKLGGMGADEVVKTCCRLLQREGSIGVWGGEVGSLAVDYWGEVTGGCRQDILCVVFREVVVYNGCIMSSCVDIFEGDWMEWVYGKDVV